MAHASLSSTLPPRMPTSSAAVAAGGAGALRDPSLASASSSFSSLPPRAPVATGGAGAPRGLSSVGSSASLLSGMSSMPAAGGAGDGGIPAETFDFSMRAFDLSTSIISGPFDTLDARKAVAKTAVQLGNVPLLELLLGKNRTVLSKPQFDARTATHKTGETIAAERSSHESTLMAAYDSLKQNSAHHPGKLMYSLPLPLDLRPSDLESLFAGDISVNEEIEGETLLVTAVKMQRVNVIQTLIAYGANAFTSPSGRSPWDIALTSELLSCLVALDSRKSHKILSYIDAIFAGIDSLKLLLMPAISEAITGYQGIVADKVRITDEGTGALTTTVKIATQRQKYFDNIIQCRSGFQAWIDSYEKSQSITAAQVIQFYEFSQKFMHSVELMLQDLITPATQILPAAFTAVIPKSSRLLNPIHALKREVDSLTKMIKENLTRMGIPEARFPSLPTTARSDAPAFSARTDLVVSGQGISDRAAENARLTEMVENLRGQLEGMTRKAKALLERQSEAMTAKDSEIAELKKRITGLEGVHTAAGSSEFVTITAEEYRRLKALEAMITKAQAQRAAGSGASARASSPAATSFAPTSGATPGVSGSTSAAATGETSSVTSVK